MGKRTRTAMIAAMAAAFSATFMAEASSMSSTLPTPTPSTERTPQDTTISSTRKIIVESFGELSKTVNKLSETALKLLEAQEALEKKEAEKSKEKGNGVYLGDENPKSRNKGVYLGDDNPPKRNKGVYLEDDTDESHIDSTDIDAESSEDEFKPEESDTEAVYNGLYLGDDPQETDSIPEDDSQFIINSIMDLSPEPGAEGSYMWIPGSKQALVEAVLNGKQVSGASEEPDLNEMTVWRGDTIPMVIRDRKIGRYDRKLYNWLMYPKGTWQGALTASYGDISTDDSEILSLMKDINISGHIYSIKPAISYFIRNNLSVGLRMAYSKGHAGIETFNVDIDEDMQFNLHDISYDTESYTAAIFMQQYYGLRRMGRFAIYNEVELAFASGNGDFIRPYNDALRQTHWTTTSVNLNFSPGVSILIMKNAAFNLSFGVFGFHLKNERQWENDEESGSRLTSGINFRFNIFNINFGVAITI